MIIDIVKHFLDICSDIVLDSLLDTSYSFLVVVLISISTHIDGVVTSFICLILSLICSVVKMTLVFFGKRQMEAQSRRVKDVAGHC